MMKQTVQTPSYLKMSEVAATTGVTTRTVFMWIAKKGLPLVVVGGVKRIKRSDLEAFMDAHIQQ